ncbi:BQ5605_C003g02506 [Microbotryum silenes-dioicae]|uniref:BQ5605_C003g02506 protein n=1 Tax=Microbotryum silenes-dioicae TaxID=796604 RepID=A0A2X0NZ05_9BASI|nr:BQ5605_C003g02506 [Microbotryum silenes-dioicae]
MNGIWAKRADNSARRLWSALSPTPHPVFVDFVCPVVSRSERRLVELRVLFFHSIWKLCRRRRFSSDLLEPITETEFEGLRASIQESKGRLVSLVNESYTTGFCQCCGPEARLWWMYQHTVVSAAPACGVGVPIRSHVQALW